MSDVAFFISGSGLGCSTRALKYVLEELANAQEVHIYTFGNGLEFYKKYDVRVFEISSYGYSIDSQGLSIKTLISSIGSFLKSCYLNNKVIRKALKKYKYKKTYWDSVYFFQWHTQKAYYLSNSKEVIKEFISNYFQLRLVPHLLVTELLERFYLKTFGYREIPLSLRQTLINQETSKGRGVLFLFSGYENLNCIDVCLDSRRENESDLIKIIGKSTLVVDGQKRTGERNYSRSDVLKALEDSSFLVVNAGFSTCREVIKSNKPSLIYPVKNHVEQYVNAHITSDVLENVVVVDDHNFQNKFKKFSELYL